MARQGMSVRGGEREVWRQEATRGRSEVTRHGNGTLRWRRGMYEGQMEAEPITRSKISVYNRMWEFMSSRKYVFTNSYEEGIERVRTSKGKYAYLLESVKNDYINEQLPCDTMKIGHDLNSNGYGVATPRDSPLNCGNGMSGEVAVVVVVLPGQCEITRSRRDVPHKIVFTSTLTGPTRLSSAE
ncbi:hypothetical protein Pmani_028308 [Petrolisthes manimaculis]|uniref:Uncharacterized protein n=1 Tax=Petrolisthes manimaculis TaxID=1843537 RepID=A0AAE1P2D0_9EUCA|nr:hypothetical protein Pmani_028308 [Petrolisthes manimaculis]